MGGVETIIVTINIWGHHCVPGTVHVHFFCSKLGRLHGSVPIERRGKQAEDRTGLKYLVQSHTARVTQLAITVWVRLMCCPILVRILTTQGSLMHRRRHPQVKKEHPGGGKLASHHPALSPDTLVCPRGTHWV